MKEIDFLPQSYHEANRRRWHNRRNLVYCLAVCTILAVMHGFTASQIRSAEASLNVLRGGANLRGTQRARITGLKRIRTALQANANIVNEIMDDAPMDALIAEITQLMGPTMALRSLSIRPASEAITTVKSDNKEPDPVRQHNRSEGILQGVAANDVEVGTFFGRLSSCPLLDEVHLSYSHEIELSGRSMREFELRFVLRRVALPEKATP